MKCGKPLLIPCIFTADCHQMTPLAMLGNLATSWYHWHLLHTWPPDGAETSSVWEFWCSLSGTLRSWGHLSFHFNLVKTGPMLRIFLLKNIFPDLPTYIECKFKWNWNTYITFVIRFVCFFAIFLQKSCPAEPTPKHKITPNCMLTDGTDQLEWWNKRF